MSPTTHKFACIITQICLVVFCVSRAGAEQAAVSVKDEGFKLCLRDSTLTGHQVLTTLDARSEVECAANCAITSGCGSFNFCPDHVTGVTHCQLMADRSAPSCGDLSTFPGSSCRHGYKVNRTKIG